MYILIENFVAVLTYHLMLTKHIFNIEIDNILSLENIKL